MDRVGAVGNWQTWRSPWALRDYRRSSGHLKEGERVAFAIAGSQAGRVRILDIGVGGGRTAGSFRPIASDYIGIDYTPEMVKLCRTNHPDLRFEHMDAGWNGHPIRYGSACAPFATSRAAFPVRCASVV